MERTTISLEEAARLELAGAWNRLMLARRAVEDFRGEHGVDESVSPDLRWSLERQQHALQVELDDAQRQHMKAKTEFVRLRRLRP